MFTRRLRILLYIATTQGLILGVYHLILPHQWGWAQGVASAPEVLQWALFALNDMWSMAIIVLHLTFLFTLVKRLPESSLLMAQILGIYWLLHTLILIIRPLPLPEGFAYVAWIAMAVPIMLCAAYGLGARKLNLIISNSNTI